MHDGVMCVVCGICYMHVGNGVCVVCVVYMVCVYCDGYIAWCLLFELCCVSRDVFMVRDVCAT